MNKKGSSIMVPFLVALVLTLVVFIPTCSFTSKLFFRLSDQSKDNFDQFAVKMETILIENAAEVQSALLILDEETAIVGFNGGSLQVKTCSDQRKSPQEGIAAFEKSCVSWKRPPVPECQSQSCVCLFRTIELSENGDIQPSLVVCKEMTSTRFSTTTHSIQTAGTELGKTTYSTEGGFVIGRKIKQGLTTYFLNPTYNPAERRTIIYLVPAQGVMTVCLDLACTPTRETIIQEVEARPGRRN